MKRKNSKVGVFEALSIFALVVFLAVAPDVVEEYPSFVVWHGIAVVLLIIASFVPWGKIREQIKANIKKAEIRRAYYLQATMREQVESNIYKPKKTRK
jgi:uncharacterized membrane protein YjfL (UPF0719 family)